MHRGLLNTYCNYSKLNNASINAIRYKNRFSSGMTINFSEKYYFAVVWHSGGNFFYPIQPISRMRNFLHPAESGRNRHNLAEAEIKQSERIGQNRAETSSRIELKLRDRTEKLPSECAKTISSKSDDVWFWKNNVRLLTYSVGSDNKKFLWGCSVLATSSMFWLGD